MPPEDVNSSVVRTSPSYVPSGMGMREISVPPPDSDAASPSEDAPTLPVVFQLAALMLVKLSVK